MKNRVITPLLLAATAGLAACSASEQDTGSNNTNIATGLKLSGTVVDGYLARAVAYIDTNNNAKLDTWEPWALTDKQGRVSKAADGTNYCTSTVAEHQDYCLTGNLVKGSTVVVRLTGGYDSVTGEPFSGSMSSTMTVGADGTVSGFTGTPLTTFVSTLSDTDAQNLADDLGVTVDELKGDFYAQTDPAKRDKLTKAALKIHKTIDVMATTLKNANDTVSTLGTEEKPTDVSDKVYAALAAKWKEEKTANGATTVDDILGNTTKLQQVLTTAESEVKKAFGTETAAYQATDSTKVTEMVNQVATLAGAVDTVFTSATAAGTGLSDAKLNAAMRAIEAVTIATRNNPTDANNGNIGAVATTAANNLPALESEQADVSLLAQEGATGSMPDFTNRPGLPSLIGYKIGMADEVDPNNKFEFYYQGDTSTAMNGKLAICLNYKKDGDTTYTKDLINGTWEALSVNGSWGTDPTDSSVYALLFNINAGGSTQSIILKSVRLLQDGTSNVQLLNDAGDPVQSTDDWEFSYDYDGELKTFKSEYGDVDTSNPNATQYGTLPTSADQCFL